MTPVNKRRGDAETRRRGEESPGALVLGSCSPRPRAPASPRLCAAYPWRRGTSVLEMALVLPVLLMLSFGIVDYGYFFYVKNTAQGAAQAGARAAIPASATNANVTTVISNMMSAAGLQGSGYTVAITDTNGAAINVSTVAAGSSIKVTVSLTWGNAGLHALSSSMGGISGSKQLVGVAVMRKES